MNNRNASRTTQNTSKMMPGLSEITSTSLMKFNKLERLCLILEKSPFEKLLNRNRNISIPQRSHEALYTNVLNMISNASKIGFKTTEISTKNSIVDFIISMKDF